MMDRIVASRGTHPTTSITHYQMTVCDRSLGGAFRSRPKARRGSEGPCSEVLNGIEDAASNVS
jgi:hypothetical protein